MKVNYSYKFLKSSLIPGGIEELALTYLVRERFLDTSLEVGLRGVLQSSDRSGLWEA